VILCRQGNVNMYIHDGQHAHHTLLVHNVKNKVVQSLGGTNFSN